MKDKSKVLKTYGYMFDKLQFMDSNLRKKITSASEDLQKLFFYALYALLSRCLASYCSR